MKIRLNISPATLFIRIISVIVLIFALTLLIFSVIFSAKTSAPEIFGYRIYIVRTDAFSEPEKLIKKGDAAFSKKISPAETATGDLVIFQNWEDAAGIAVITSAELKDGTYNFSALTETGANITLTEGQIVGKVVKKSTFLGGFISFARSSTGVFVFAVLPPLAMITAEIIAKYRKSINESAVVVPINKLDEVPTYVPEKRIKNKHTVVEDTPSLFDKDILAETEKKLPKTQSNKVSSEEDIPLNHPKKSRSNYQSPNPNEFASPDEIPLFTTTSMRKTTKKTHSTVDTDSRSESLKKLEAAIALANSRTRSRQPFVSGNSSTLMNSDPGMIKKGGSTSPQKLPTLPKNFAQNTRPVVERPEIVKVPLQSLPKKNLSAAYITKKNNDDE